ncbi:MAG: Mth938-like domain-containing protein [Pseudomonadota bacterium]
MRLNEITYTNAVPVDGYGPGFFRIGNQIYRGAVMTGPGGTVTWGGYTDADPLLALADQIDVLFIGTGSEVAHIPSELRQVLEAAGLGVEVMNSPAACRTYNVLLSEGRRIALALIPVSGDPASSG